MPRTCHAILFSWWQTTGLLFQTSIARRCARLKRRCYDSKRRYSLFAGVVLFAAALMGCVTGVSRQDVALEYFNIGNAYYELGRYEEASGYYIRALDLDPSLSSSTYNLARAYIQRERFTAAVAVLEDLRTEDPENILVLQTLGYALTRLGRNGEAVDVLERAEQLSPFNLTVLYNLGVLHGVEERYDEAYDILLRAHRVDESDQELVLMLAETSLALGREDEAIEFLERFDQPEDAERELLLRLARLYSEATSYSDALNVYATLRDRDPEDKEVLFREAELNLTFVEDAESGLERLEEALELGYSERSALTRLVTSPNLIQRSRVEQLYEEYGFDAASLRDPVDDSLDEADDSDGDDPAANVLEEDSEGIEGQVDAESTNP
ncbi:MAG: tetratricopeptide repeat protein [Spirochaetaceae bacterium]|nr:MAG: tetratricopeptide repeat protein [Spirochaetaceae bacterium]